MSEISKLCPFIEVFNPIKTHETLGIVKKTTWGKHLWYFIKINFFIHVMEDTVMPS